jgi:hypothetical protein
MQTALATETHGAPHFDHYAFGDRRQRPASAKTGLSYQDFTAMNVYQKKQSGERRLPTPEWALTDPLLREVLIVYLENRLGIKPNPDSTLDERRVHVQQVALAQRPRMEKKLDQLNREYVFAQRDGAPKESLQIMGQEIENLDTYLRYTHADGGLATIAAVVYCYYRLCQDSVGVGDTLTLKPPHVRQILFRLNNVATEKLGYAPSPRRKLKQWGPVDIERAKELCLAGMSYLEIAKNINHRSDAVAKALKNCGISRPPKESPAARIARLKAAGLCTVCEALSAPFRRCEVCRKREATYQAARYHIKLGHAPRPAPSAPPLPIVEFKGTRLQKHAARVAAGLCGVLYCNNPASPGYKSCESCRTYFNAKQRKYSAEKKKAGNN